MEKKNKKKPSAKNPLSRSAERPSAKRPLSILLTGVPGTGKTSISREWCTKSNWAYLSLNELVKAEGLYSGRDERDGARIVEMGKLEAAANDWLLAMHSPAIIEGHLGCDIKLKVDRVLVLRLHPGVLVERLRARKYNAYQLGENKMAELLDYCTLQSIKNYGERKVYELDLTGKTLEQNVAALRRFARAAEPRAAFKSSVSWKEALLAHIAQNVKDE